MTTILLRRGSAAEWISANPILGPGEAGVELDTNKLKVGDGVLAWDALKHYLPTGDETDSQSNTSYGQTIHTALTTGANNTAVGKSAQFAITSGGWNVGVGTAAQSMITTGGRNVALGHQAQMSLVSTFDNIAIGYLAQRVAIGTDNVAIGTNAQVAMLNAVGNVAVGKAAQTSLTTGGSNVAVGTQALAGLTTGGSNVAIGHQALYAPKNITANASITTSYQIGIGYQAGSYLAGIGASSVAIGYRALTHTNAVAIGGIAEAQGSSSVAIGYGAIATLASQIMLGAATHRVYVNNDPVDPLEVATRRFVLGDTAWTQPTLTNSWVNFGAPYTVARYRKMGDGMVLIEGLVKSGTISVPIFTLPAGYRPVGGQMGFIVASNTGFARIDLLDSGAVQVAVYGTGGSNVAVHLTGIRFLAEA